MHHTSTRRAALASLLIAFALVAAGCERRTADPVMPSTSPGMTSPANPSMSTPGNQPDSGASAASR